MNPEDGRNGTGPTPLPAWARGSGSDAPDWATRANEPLVPTADLANVKKDVKKDLKEIQRAVDDIAKLSRKKRDERQQQQILSLSEQVRRRARGTSAKIRDALGQAGAGSADYASFSNLSEQLKETLGQFKKHMEAQAPAAPAAPTTSVAPLESVAIDRGMGGEQQMQQQETAATTEQIHAVQTNDLVIADREVGIENIARTVQEIHEIYQDMNALVREQGEHIDNIQTNIEKAGNHQERAVRELVSASRYQRRSKKCMCWLIVLVIILLIVCIIILKVAGPLR